jgi:hypothetical protein
MSKAEQLLTVAALAALTTMAYAENSVLKSLPTEVQKQIADVRTSCSGKRITRGDEGLKRLTFKGSPAVLVDTYCGTGDTHSVEIYAWKKVFSTWTQGPVRLNTDHGDFKSMDLRVFAGDHGCPESDRPRVACDAIVRWNGLAFTYDLVGAEKSLPVEVQDDVHLLPGNRPTVQRDITAKPERPSVYELDRAHFASSTDWFIVDNYPTPKKTDPTKALYFRRFYFPYVDDTLREGQLANAVTFVCQKRHLNHLLIHLPDDADIKTIRPRKQWISKTELRVLTDDFAATFDAEYIDGDFFVDFKEDTLENLNDILRSRFLTIEFGPGNEKLSLYAGDMDPAGKADFKGALKEMVPMMAKSFGGKSRAIGTTEMFKLCDTYKANRR